MFASCNVNVTNPSSVIALSKLYSLNDARLAQTMVKGDLVVNSNNDGRIMTRSRAKASKYNAEFFHCLDC